jgi:hypothetical protein
MFLTACKSQVGLGGAENGSKVRNETTRGFELAADLGVLRREAGRLSKPEKGAKERYDR